MTITEYALSRGISVMTAYKRVNRLGVGTMDGRGRMLSEADVVALDAIGVKPEGTTLYDYAKQTGRHYNTVMNIARKYHIGTRTKRNGTNVVLLADSDIVELEKHRNRYELVDGQIKVVRR